MLRAQGRLGLLAQLLVVRAWAGINVVQRSPARSRGRKQAGDRDRPTDLDRDESDRTRHFGRAAR
jgi:hypothetical protein